MPPDNSELTEALLSNMSVVESKHFIVRLKRGFLVSGRIVDREGKGLKGIKVKVEPQVAGIAEDDVHGCGEAVTTRGGFFKLALTPGKKMFEMSNFIYPELVGSANKNIVVIGDEKLADIILSDVHRGGAH
jgi:hypothetical protein